MIKYINYYDYDNLKDQSEYYCVKYLYGTIKFINNKCLHREDGPAIIWSNGIKEYWLNNKWYGNEYNYTDESWTRLCKLKAFQ